MNDLLLRRIGWFISACLTEKKPCIWQADDWPAWRYDLPGLATLLTEVSHAQGMLLGRLADVGLALRVRLASPRMDRWRLSARVYASSLTAASGRKSVLGALGMAMNPWCR